MRWPFRKKIDPPVLIEPLPCNHKWYDFPPFLDYTLSQNVLHVWITEPYICIYCKEREDKRLVDDTYGGVSKAGAEDILNHYKKEYEGLLKPVGVVEDMVNDFQMVDKQSLEIAQQLGFIKKIDKG